MDNIADYKLADIAPILCPSQGKKEVYLTSRRLQNWVTFGLLAPIGEKHGGRGVHRQYDRHEIFKAAVLLELFRYQVPVAVMQVVARLFDEVRTGESPIYRMLGRKAAPGARRKQRALDQLLHAATEGDAPIYLHVSYDLDKPEAFLAQFGRSAALNDEWPSGIVLNLSRIATRIR